MSRKVRYSAKARADLNRLYDFLLDRDVEAAERALDAIVSRVSGLVHFPNTGRRIEQDGQTFRELLIPFGGTGYLALYQLAKDGDVQILAIRHQREDDDR
ncbi:plasmid stabilization system protein ParE [Peteryoungia aggregata LMG 23059]|uniref:Plasmid stabilization system protein ParE n=1 Tax=Peteryoungia aggregata LMG 23059 TaxID=1368425 RepID=A0ABU0GAZ4_9HYPH|nr:type II toxin-antitoxin system RelE/ParE family toxin [Peteryoungia aggregata]MDQ0422524.1 plasmid stabilization system protein ParE [Peteryoungia aggregata LMG 23059]